MTELKLAAEKREGIGKSVARKLRRGGKIPAVLYGEIEDPIKIAIDEHDLNVGLRGHHSVIVLEIDGEPHKCIIRDVQYHPVTSRILHVDFMGIKAHERIQMEIPVEFEGKPEGVKEGGIFDEIKRILEISVLPENIPDVIKINVDNLEIGQSIRIKDLQFDGFDVLGDPDDVICRVEAPRGAEEVEEEEVEEEEMEPEVISKGKEDKEEE
ncbi:MAG: 50S ribosomal protein L25 [Calditrichaeota bacterium]|nr:50S ribosomal protein L25 [Calditrichota bacterium]